jgi:CheY-like chemotaxis protein
MSPALPDRSTETALPRRPKAVTFGMDAESLADLRRALPGWRIDCLHGATVGSMPHDWDPGEPDLFVVSLRENVTEALGLCRLLASWPSCENEPQEEASETLRLDGKHENARCGADVPLVVLVSSGQDTLVGAALEVGARACLQLPISIKDVAEFLNRAAVDDLSNRQESQGDRGAPESH